MNVLIAGAGYIGLPLAHALAEDGHEVLAIRRRVGQSAGRLRWLTADLTTPLAGSHLPETVDAVVFCASPEAFDEQAYQRTFLQAQLSLLTSLIDGGRLPARYIMVGSTAVYSPGEGEWVDTDTPCHPERFAGQILMTAEQALRERLEERLIVARLTGIYGPGRCQGMITRLLDSGCNPQQYTNRIHRDDAVGFLRHLISLEQPRPAYLVSDSTPVDQCSLAQWLAGHLQRPLPETTPDKWSKRGNRRVSNRAMLESGYRMLYPDFRDGLAQALARTQ